MKELNNSSSDMYMTCLVTKTESLANNQGLSPVIMRKRTSTTRVADINTCERYGLQSRDGLGRAS